jgi:hypothetical protein
VLDRIKAIVDEELEKLRSAAPDPRELERAKNGIETQFLRQMEVVAAKADQLNSYFTNTGNPDYFGEDIARYLVLEPNDVQAAVRRWLPKDRRLEISVIPGVKNDACRASATCGCGCVLSAAADRLTIAPALAQAPDRSKAPAPVRPRRSRCRRCRNARWRTACRCGSWKCTRCPSST